MRSDWLEEAAENESHVKDCTGGRVSLRYTQVRSQLSENDNDKETDNR